MRSSFPAGPQLTVPRLTTPAPAPHHSCAKQDTEQTASGRTNHREEHGISFVVDCSQPESARQHGRSSHPCLPSDFWERSSPRPSPMKTRKGKLLLLAASIAAVVVILVATTHDEPEHKGAPIGAWINVLADSFRKDRIAMGEAQEALAAVGPEAADQVMDRIALHDSPIHKQYVRLYEAAPGWFHRIAGQPRSDPLHGCLIEHRRWSQVDRSTPS